ncbi:MAG TPA: phosphatase PAP2 family protein [Gemmatimonadaceae bacterium]
MYRMERKPAALHLCRAAVLGLALSLTPLASRAQQSRPPDPDLSVAPDARLQAPDDSAGHEPPKTFFVKRDLVAGGIAFAASVAVSSFDLRIAHWARSQGVQGDSTRYNRVSTATRVNETPLTIAAFATYGIGRLAHSKTTADVGLHTFEALVLTTAMSEVLRGTMGRTRPREAPEDPFLFKPGKGFTEFETRSYPSLHTAAAFATATALVGEIRLRKPEATKVAAPLLYTAAMIPGLTRIYLDQHWASDVVAGGFLGALLGSRVVSYAHSHQRNWLDRALLSVNVVPDGHGGTLVLVELPQ